MPPDWTEQMNRDAWGEAWDNAHHDEPGQPWDPERWPEPTQLHPAVPDAPSAPQAYTRAPEPPRVVTGAALIVSPARRTREPAPPVDRARALRTILEEQARRFSKP